MYGFNILTLCFPQKNPDEGVEDTIKTLESWKGKAYEMVLESLEKDSNDVLLVLNHGLVIFLQLKPISFFILNYF